MKAAALLLLLGCTTVRDAGGQVAEWVACPTSLIDCGHVYVCATPADNELGVVEICVDVDDQPGDLDAAEAIYGACEPTPRHQGLCIWCPAGAGANAFNGSFDCAGEW